MSDKHDYPRTAIVLASMGICVEGQWTLFMDWEWVEKSLRQLSQEEFEGFSSTKEAERMDAIDSLGKMYADLNVFFDSIDVGDLRVLFEGDRSVREIARSLAKDDA